MFTGIIFHWETTFLMSYALKNNYKLLIGIHALYDKFCVSKARQLNQFLLKSFSVHWFRVSFRGKGYRLRKFKTNNKVTLNFGHSHWAKLALDRETYFFKKIRRQNYLCSAKGYSFYKDIKFGFKVFKKLNTYTKRGLRLRKQYIRKRFGKISQVVSSLH